MKRIRPGIVALTGAALLGITAPAFAASTGGGASRGNDTGSAETQGPDEADRLYERGLELSKDGKFEEALARFEQANKKRKKDPEILNMLAYCQRKTGDIDSAFQNYAKALEIRPKFPQAREYLAEAHLQAALEQLRILRGYGREGEEELWALVAAIRKASADLDSDSADGEKTGQGW